MAMYYYARRLQKSAKRKSSAKSVQPSVAALTEQSNLNFKISPMPARTVLSTTPVKEKEVGKLTSVNHVTETFAKLKSTTLDDLINHLMNDNLIEQEFVFNFLLSYRIFIRPHELLSTIRRRVFTEDSIPPVESSKVRALIALLQEWTTSFPQDFSSSPKMMLHLRYVATGCVLAVPASKTVVQQILEDLLKRLTCLDSLPSFSLNRDGLSLPKNDSVILMLVCNSNKMCQQLTLVEKEKFKSIWPQQFLEALLPQSSSTRPVHSYVNWFHRLTLCVILDVCGKCGYSKGIEYWSSVAHSCLQIGNYNSAMAIFTGINSRIVTNRRYLLKKSQVKVQQSAHAVKLREVFDPSNNFENYRRHLKTCVSVPFISLLIKDLYLLKEGVTRTSLPYGQIDYERIQGLAQYVKEVMGWQQKECGFEPDENVMELLRQLHWVQDYRVEISDGQSSMLPSGISKSYEEASTEEINSDSNTSSVLLPSIISYNCNCSSTTVSVVGSSE